MSGLPLVPGHPGTLITNRMEITSNGPWNIWVRATDKALWLNMGLYICTKSTEPLTAKEWKALSPTVRASKWDYGLYLTITKSIRNFPGSGDVGDMFS